MHGTVSHRAPHARLVAQLTQMRPERSEIFVYDTRLAVYPTSLCHIIRRIRRVRAKVTGIKSLIARIDTRCSHRYTPKNAITRCIHVTKKDFPVKINQRRTPVKKIYRD